MLSASAIALSFAEFCKGGSQFLDMTLDGGSCDGRALESTEAAILDLPLFLTM